MELERGIVSSLFPINYSPNLTNATVTGLSPFTAYNCSLTASNAVGPGPPAIDTPMTEPSGEREREGEREGGREGERERERIHVLYHIFGVKTSLFFTN